MLDVEVFVVEQRRRRRLRRLLRRPSASRVVVFHFVTGVTLQHPVENFQAQEEKLLKRFSRRRPRDAVPGLLRLAADVAVVAVDADLSNVVDAASPEIYFPSRLVGPEVDSNRGLPRIFERSPDAGEQQQR